MAADDWVGTRWNKTTERLTRSYFDTEHIGRGQCLYCEDDYGAPGIVFMWRDNNTILLRPNHCSCTLCGQHYYVALEDLETMCGLPATAENIYDFEAVIKDQARWRSIDEQWHAGT